MLCYSRLSGTLVPTYLSMSVQAAENKLICFSFYPPSSLSSPSFTSFLPSLSLYINLCLTRPPLSISSLFSSLCSCKMQHFPSSFLSVLRFSPFHTICVFGLFFRFGKLGQDPLLHDVMLSISKLCKNRVEKNPQTCFWIKIHPLCYVLNGRDK